VTQFNCISGQYGLVQHPSNRFIISSGPRLIRRVFSPCTAIVRTAWRPLLAFLGGTPVMSPERLKVPLGPDVCPDSLTRSFQIT
jgi:hypothetical protein